MIKDPDEYLNRWIDELPQQFKRMLAHSGRIKDRREQTLSAPRPELQSPAMNRPMGPYGGPIK